VFGEDLGGVNWLGDFYVEGGVVAAVETDGVVEGCGGLITRSHNGGLEFVL
jgi:hypothetical protein